MVFKSFQNSEINEFESLNVYENYNFIPNVIIFLYVVH